MTRTAAGTFLCALALAGCVATSTPDPVEPPTATLASTPTPTPTEVAGIDQTAFRSESTVCQFDAPDSTVPGVGCQMNHGYTYEIPAAWVDFGIPCADISLGYDADQGTLGCASDVSYLQAQDTDPLPVGTVVRHGGIVCTLLEVGVTCTNEAGGEATITPDHFVAQAG